MTDYMRWGPELPFLQPKNFPKRNIQKRILIRVYSQDISWIFENMCLIVSLAIIIASATHYRRLLIVLVDKTNKH